MQNSFYGETEKHYQKQVFLVFRTLVGRKTPKCMESTMFEETKRHYEKYVLKVFLSLFGIKTLKRIKNSLYGETTFSKSVYFKCFFFHIIKYQNDKMHAKLLLIWENEATLKETCLLSVSQSLRHKKP